MLEVTKRALLDGSSTSSNSGSVPGAAGVSTTCAMGEGVGIVVKTSNRGVVGTLEAIEEEPDVGGDVAMVVGAPVEGAVVIPATGAIDGAVVLTTVGAVVLTMGDKVGEVVLAMGDMVGACGQHVPSATFICAHESLPSSTFRASATNVAHVNPPSAEITTLSSTSVPLQTEQGFSAGEGQHVSSADFI